MNIVVDYFGVVIAFGAVATIATISGVIWYQNYSEKKFLKEWREKNGRF
jgi:hypothetical protein